MCWRAQIVPGGGHSGSLCQPENDRSGRRPRESLPATTRHWESGVATRGRQSPAGGGLLLLETWVRGLCGQGAGRGAVGWGQQCPGSTCTPAGAWGTHGVGPLTLGDGERTEDTVVMGHLLWARLGGGAGRPGGPSPPRQPCALLSVRRPSCALREAPVDAGPTAGGPRRPGSPGVKDGGLPRAL